ncbi:MAG: prepilin-type N-terminal cleavage/methylation domain-containing protein [Azoarcus sp.]|nr:prepilin-type N-terminal cleavage/methylation domain-containing protein [Azoarcus sp.]
MFNKVRFSQSGLTLIELMIAMVLGLVLLLGVTNFFLGQRQAYRVNENLARMQDSARTAFELMAREIREAGGNPCGTPNVDNVVPGFAASTWLNWDVGGLEGFGGGDPLPGTSFGEDVGQRVAGTDALIVRSGSLNNGLIITEHTPGTSRLKVNTVAHGISEGVVLMACDYSKATIFQVTDDLDGTDTIEYGGALSQFARNGFLTRLSATAWYIGNNTRGGRSLFRHVFTEGASQEIAEGVADMDLAYLLRVLENPESRYMNAADVKLKVVANTWADPATRVVAVRVVLDLESRDLVGTDAATLKRQLVHVVSLRHREIVE